MCAIRLHARIWVGYCFQPTARIIYVVEGRSTPVISPQRQTPFFLDKPTPLFRDAGFNAAGERKAWSSHAGDLANIDKCCMGERRVSLRKQLQALRRLRQTSLVNSVAQKRTCRKTQRMSVMPGFDRKR